jgi:hypothetical protein
VQPLAKPNRRSEQETLRSQIWCPKEEHITDHLFERFLDLDSSGFIWIHEGYISPHPNKNGAVIKNMEIGQTVVIQQSLDHDGLIIGS